MRMSPFSKSGATGDGLVHNTRGTINQIARGFSN